MKLRHVVVIGAGLFLICVVGTVVLKRDRNAVGSTSRGASARDPEPGSGDRRVRRRRPGDSNRKDSEVGSEAPGSAMPSESPAEPLTTSRRRASDSDVPAVDPERIFRLLGEPDRPPRAHFELLDSAEEYAGYFVRVGVTRRVVASGDVGLQDGDARVDIEYPEGSYALDPERWGLRDVSASPTDMLIEGAGMNKTLLTLKESIELTGAVRITFRDLTVHCNSKCFIVLRNAPALIHLERCRVIGFDGGRNASHLIRGNAAAILCKDCEIESGYGVGPGGASFLNTSPSSEGEGRITVAKFERTLFRGPFSPPSVSDRPFLKFRRSMAVLFSECEFERMFPEGVTAPGPSGSNVRYLNCVVVPSETGDSAGVRSVAELNAKWSDPTSSADAK